MHRGTVRPNGETIRRLRLRTELTQEELAGRVGCDPKTIQNIEAGNPCRPVTLAAIAGQLGVKVDLLILWDESRDVDTTNRRLREHRLTFDPCEENANYNEVLALLNFVRLKRVFSADIMDENCCHAALSLLEVRKQVEERVGRLRHASLNPALIAILTRLSTACANAADQLHRYCPNLIRCEGWDAGRRFAHEFALMADIILDMRGEVWSLVCEAQRMNNASGPGQDRIDYYVAQLRDNDIDVQKDALRALGELRGAKAFAPVVQMLGNAPEELQWYARDTSHKIAAANPETILDSFLALAREGKFTASEVGDFFSAALRVAPERITDAMEHEYQRSDSEELRQVLREAAAKNKLEKWRTRILSAMNDPSSAIREKAVYALKLLGGDDVEEAFLRALKDTSPSVRDASLNSLVFSVWQNRAVERLAKLLIRTDLDVEIRKRVLEHLVSCGDESRVAATNIPKPYQAIYLVCRAGKLPKIAETEPVPAAMKTALSDPDPFVRVLAIDALLRVCGKEARSSYQQMLADSSSSVRRAALAALLAPSESATADNDLRRKLTHIVFPDGAEELERQWVGLLALVTKDEAIRKVANRLVGEEALVRIGGMLKDEVSRLRELHFQMRNETQEKEEAVGSGDYALAAKLRDQIDLRKKEFDALLEACTKKLEMLTTKNPHAF